MAANLHDTGDEDRLLLVGGLPRYFTVDSVERRRVVWYKTGWGAGGRGSGGWDRAYGAVVGRVGGLVV